MTNITETAVWEEFIRQIDRPDPVVGGPPSLDPLDGIANIAAQQLANRTGFLLGRLTGLGDVAILTADFNAIAKTGFYRGENGATGHPNPGGGPAMVLHIEGDSGEAWQTGRVGEILTLNRYRATTGGAWSSWDKVRTDAGYFQDIPGGDIDALYTPGTYGGRGSLGVNPTGGTNPFPDGDGYFVVEVDRRFVGSDNFVVQRAHLLTFADFHSVYRTRQSGGWSAWQRVWIGDYAEAETARIIGEESPVTAAATGSKTHEGNLIEKWGLIYLNADQELVTFDLAFPTACLHVMVCDATTSGFAGSAVRAYGVESDTITAANFRIRSDGDVGNVMWRAIGH